MGNICYMQRNPRLWGVRDDGLHLKTGEPIVKVVVGDDFDDYGGRGDIAFFMRKDIYNKLIDGEYIVKVIPRDGWITVYDKQGEKIPYRKRGFCY